VNDMRELLSGALPAPQDEPQQRDVIDAAMDWGARRRRRDWALSGAAALAVLAVGTGAVAMAGGSGNGADPGSGGRTVTSTAVSSAPSSPKFPAGAWWTPYCDTPVAVKENLAKYCSLFDEEQNFNVAFAQGSVKYIQAALPQGFTVKKTDAWVLILTGPNGKTNYMFPSAEPASTLDKHPLSCGVPAQTGCVQTSTAGGTLVVNGWPSGDPSAGYVGSGLKDPRVDILLGTSATGGLNRMEPPTSAQPLLSNAQLAAILSDPGFLNYAKAQLQHLKDITAQLQSMTPPSPSGSLTPATPPPWPSGIPSGLPSSGATGSWSQPMPTNSSLSQPTDGGTIGYSQPPWSQSSGAGRPSGSLSSGGGISSSESWPGIPVSSGS